MPAFGFEKNPAASEQLAKAIQAHGATHLIMGVGSPKSELWVHAHRGDLGDIYAFGIGAGVDFFVGLEWSWRLAHEPKRLWKRYLVDSWLFFVAIWPPAARRRLRSAAWPWPMGMHAFGRRSFFDQARSGDRAQPPSNTSPPND